MELVKIFKALSDSNRLRALLALKDRELCVCQMVEMLSLAPSTVSKHMSILADAGLLISQKKGRWVYYRWTEAQGTNPAQLLDLVADVAKHETILADDQERLTQILKLDPEELCRVQAQRANAE